MTTPSLIDWLRAQIDEDERLALAASEAPWRRWPEEGAGSPSLRWSVALPGQRTGDTAAIATVRAEDSDHIANWDPARVLAEVQSRRKLIDIMLQHAAKIDGEWGCCHGPEAIALGHCPETSVDGISGLRALAEPYRSRPGFREEWKWTT